MGIYGENLTCAALIEILKHYERTGTELDFDIQVKSATAEQINEVAKMVEQLKKSRRREADSGFSFIVRWGKQR
jgi:hypothetical protein